jgi:chromosome segregation ATPase
VSDFDQIADELYALRPDEFAAARDEHVRKARADGRQPLARELSRLRRPTQSAWLLNLLWRDQRDVIEQFLEVAEGLKRAQAQAAGAQMRTLNAQRRELEAALIRQARSLAEKQGVSVTASTEREAQETLAAALARPDVAHEMRTGRLVKPAAYAGFGTPMSGAPAAHTQVERPLSEKDLPEPTRLADAKRGAKMPDAEAEARRAERERRARERRAEAEQAVEQARAQVESATRSLAERTRAAEMAQQHAQEVQTQLDQLRAQVRDLETTAAQARDSAHDAYKEQEQASKTHAQAVHALERAEHELHAANADS